MILRARRPTEENAIRSRSISECPGDDDLADFPRRRDFLLGSQQRHTPRNTAKAARRGFINRLKEKRLMGRPAPVDIDGFSAYLERNSTQQRRSDCVRFSS